MAALLVVATQSLIGTSPASAASTPPAYYPSGPQVNVPVATVTDGGWTECFVDKYADGLHAALPGLLDACTGKYLMLAGRATGSSTLGLLAAAPRDDVLFDTGTGDTTHVANGTGWYFADNWSWGFAKAGDSVERSSCDVASVDGALRLCWHTAAYGGFRLGTDTTLNGSTDFERVVYQTGVQKITFTSTAPADAVPGDTYTAAATGGASGNPVVLSIAAASSSVCSLDGSTVTFNHPGTCTVDADQDGNGDFSAGHGEQAITVSKIAQPVTFTSTAPTDAVAGTTYDVTATGGASGKPVTLSIDPASSSLCSVDGSTVTIAHPGNCVVDADQAGNTDYAAGHAQQTVTAGKIAQPVAFTSTAPTDAVAGTTYDVTATGGASGKPVTLSIDPASSSLCSVDGSTVTIAHPGDCVVDADQAGNTDYAAGHAQQTVTAGKIAQAVAFTSTAPTGAVKGDTYDVTATGGASGKPVTFSIDPASSSLCSVDGSTVTFAHAGDCVVDADQGGNTDYAAATRSQQTVAVGKAAQAITFTSTAPADAVVGGTYDLTATGGASGKPVTFSIDPASSSLCSVDGSTVTFAHAGDCVVDADQAGDSDYRAATQSQQTVAVGKAAQAIAFSSTVPTGAVLGDTYDVTATGGASGSPVGFSIDAASSDVCSVDGSTVTFLHAGDCVVDADQDGTADYTAAPQSQQTVTVVKTDQAITFTSAAPTDAVVGATYDVVASGGASGNAVSFSVDPASSDVCSVDGSTVTFAHTGECVVDADQDSTADYNAAPQSQQTVTVSKAAQAVAFTSTVPADAVVGATYDVAATGGASGNPVAFAIADDSSDVCSLDGSTVTFAHPGDCVVDADQDGSTDYVAAAQVEQHVAVAQASTTTGIMVKRGQIVAHVTANAPGAGTPTGSVDFTVGTTQVGSARLVDGIATLTHDVAAGATRTVAARYRGDADFTASSASTARKDPRITASVSSTAPKSGRGWYSAPVTVHFHCSTNGAPLATACPAPVTLRANRAGQTATGTVAAVDGGIATAAVSGINIDTVKPKVRIRGIHRGATYVQKPKPRCVGHDQLSGVVSCRLTHRKVGNRIRWKAVATDKAGNTRKVTVRTTVLPVDVQGAHQSGGVFSVTSGRTYTLVVKGSATRPVYYDAALAPHRPVQRDKAFLPAGHHRWALGVTMAPHMDSHSRWNLGVKIGGKLLIVKVRIR